MANTKGGEPSSVTLKIFVNKFSLNQLIIYFLLHVVHIYDLPAALQACYACNKFGGTLYSYFAPIYSCITGDHGSIPTHDKFQEKPHGLHLLTPVDQRKTLIKAGITDSIEIQKFLGKVNLIECLIVFFMMIMRGYVPNPCIMS